MKAVLLVSHGSHSPKAKEENSRLLSRLREKGEADIFRFAFLEIEKPSIPEGIDNCVKDGAAEIIVLLNFLNSGRHVDEDIPRIAREARAKYPKVKLVISKPVGQHKRIDELFLDMISS